MPKAKRGVPTKRLSISAAPYEVRFKIGGIGQCHTLQEIADAYRQDEVGEVYDRKKRQAVPPERIWKK